MKTGALEFLTKPFRDRELLDAIHQAIQRDCANRKDQAEIAEQSSGRRGEQRWDYRHSKKSNRVQKTERLSAVLGSVAPKTPNYANQRANSFAKYFAKSHKFASPFRRLAIKHNLLYVL